MHNFVSAYTTTHSKEASAVVYNEYSPADTWEATAYFFLIQMPLLGFRRCGEGKERAWCYCSRMCQISMVTLQSKSRPILVYLLKGHTAGLCSFWRVFWCQKFEGNGLHRFAGGDRWASKERYVIACRIAFGGWTLRWSCKQKLSGVIAPRSSFVQSMVRGRHFPLGKIGWREAPFSHDNGTQIRKTQHNETFGSGSDTDL